MNYSVLMSVYKKERPEYLKAAMDSIWDQTVGTDDFVLVCDGPLTEGLDDVIADMQQDHPQLNVVRLDKNMGLGIALNEGLGHCKNELVARMDSDDISRKNRCEKQLKVFNKWPVLDICSGTVEEFSESVDEVDAKRVLPKKPEEIANFAKKRNPFNHPCVMYKKSAVQQAGGYQDFHLLEDYFLWIRMLQNGAKGYNIEAPILWMRAGSDMYRRRSGIDHALSQVKLFKYMRDTQYISNFDFIKSAVIRFCASLVPNFVRKNMFKLFLRK